MAWHGNKDDVRYEGRRDNEEAWRKVTETLQVGWMKRGCEIEAGAGQGKLKRNANLE